VKDRDADRRRRRWSLRGSEAFAARPAGRRRRSEWMKRETVADPASAAAPSMLRRSTPVVRVRTKAECRQRRPADAENFPTTAPPATARAIVARSHRRARRARFTPPALAIARAAGASLPSGWGGAFDLAEDSRPPTAPHGVSTPGRNAASVSWHPDSKVAPDKIPIARMARMLRTPSARIVATPMRPSIATPASRADGAV